MSDEQEHNPYAWAKGMVRELIHVVAANRRTPNLIQRLHNTLGRMSKYTSEEIEIAELELGQLVTQRGTLEALIADTKKLVAIEEAQIAKENEAKVEEEAKRNYVPSASASLA